MLLATLVFTSACSEDDPIQDDKEQTTPGEDDGEEGNEGNENEGEGGNVDGGNGRYLVLYCSRTGNTERMAQTIQSTLDCDMIVVEPETPYEDDYNAMLDRAQAELDAIEQGNYPAITTSVESGMAILQPQCRLSCTTMPICWQENVSPSLPAAEAVA